MSEEILKIMAISLMGANRSKAYAVFNGEQLVITRVDGIPGMLGTWRKQIIDEIEDKNTKGYVVLVEEKSDIIARHATQYLLEDVEERSNLYDALDWYFALQDMGNLIADEAAKRFLIKAGSEGQKIEKKQDDKGRAYYAIDWSSFTGAHRAILLCVVAAMSEPVSERFLQAMYGDGPEEPADDNPVRRWQKLTVERDVQKGLTLEAQREKLACETIRSNINA